MGYPYGQPGYGYPPPVYGYPQQQPGGGSAITAAVFALIVGLIGAVGVIIGLVGVVSAKNEVNNHHSFGPSAPEVPDFLFGLVALGGVAAFLWLLGAILLFRRSSAGRVILIIMSSLSLVGLAISAATSNPAAFVVGIVPLTILILASLSSTGRWIAAGRAAHPPQYPYPPAPVYGQPPQYPHY
ncbi:hypothetical protein ACLMAL_05805 [Nocardia sp. CWNU-33]|uniref:hypothetical protein n=1 Tax=Nocardia sp. CWNU-33 TaxID=3392117 RepID=UPI00398F25F2